MSEQTFSKSGPLSMRQKIGYGFADFGSQFIYSTSSLFLVYFLTDVALVGPALVGMIMLLTRIWDAVIDPLLGYVADHVNTRWGQKRPFLLFSAIPLGLSLILVFMVPGLRAPGKFVYYLLTTLFMWTGFSFFQIPAGAMLPNLTLDAQERAQIAGVSKGMTLIGLIVIGAVSTPIVNAFAKERVGFAVMAVIYGVITAVSILIAFFSTQERVQVEPEERYSIRETVRLIAGNTPFVIMCVNLLFVFMVYTITGAMINYFFEYNLQSAEFIPIAFTSIFGVAALSMPLWIYLSKKMGKKNAYLLSMAIYGIMFLVLYWLHSASLATIIPVFVVAGIGFSGINLGSMALLPDTVEYAQWKFGKRIEGVQQGLSSFMTTLAASLGGFIVGQGLDVSGYEANVAQTEQALLGIRFLATIVPAGLMVVAIIVLLFYPITEKVHQRMLTEIEQGV